MKTIYPKQRQSRRQIGMSLIEVMVAIVILALGALGIAALQARALRGNESSLQRTQAVIAANSLLDTMRAGEVPLNTIAMTCAGGSGKFAEWLTDLQNGLGPSGCGRIVCTAVGAGGAPAGTRVCTVTIQWDDGRAGGVANQQLALGALL